MADESERKTKAKELRKRLSLLRKGATRLSFPPVTRGKDNEERRAKKEEEVAKKESGKKESGKKETEES